MKNEAEFLPEGWAWASVSELARYVTSGSRDWSAFYSDTGALFIRTQDINTNTLRWRESASVQLPQSIEGKRALVTVGDMLITITGANVGKCALVEEELPEAYVSQSVALVKWADPVIGKIARLACLRPMAGGQTVLQELAYGLGRPVLSLKQIRELQLPIPPLGEQRRIVALTEALQTCAEKARSALDAIPPLLEKFRQSVLAAAFRGDLTREWRARNPDVEPASVLLERIEPPRRPSRFQSRSMADIPGQYALSVGNTEMPAPPGWQWTLLLDVAQLESGHTPSRSHPEYWDGSIPWVSIPDARDNHGEVITETKSHITEAGIENSASRIIPKDAVFLCRTAASIGYTLILGRPMATSQDLVAWIPTEALNPHFLMWLFIAEKESILRFGKGSAHKTVYFPEIMSFHVCLPSRAEQDEIVSVISARMQQIKRLEGAHRQASSRLPALDQAILAKAFRGELVPQDPSDEPASVLLGRIRAERAAAEANGKLSRKPTRAPRPKTATPKRGPSRKKAPA